MRWWRACWQWGYPQVSDGWIGSGGPCQGRRVVAPAQDLGRLLLELVQPEVIEDVRHVEREAHRLGAVAHQLGVVVPGGALHDLAHVVGFPRSGAA